MTDQANTDPLTLPRDTAAALHDLLGQLLDKSAAIADPEHLREQLHEAIESEVYEYRERTMFWPEGAVTTEIARLATRGAMEALTAHGDSRGYCPACGRGDCAPTADEYEQQRQRAQQLAATLNDVLRHFVHKGHPGEPCLSSGWISEKTVARWRAVAYPPKEQS